MRTHIHIIKGRSHALFSPRNGKWRSQEKKVAMAAASGREQEPTLFKVLFGIYEAEAL